MMKYTEELLWILDKEGKRLKGDEEYQQNIDFVHSLGLKCDCVGWSTLKLSDPRADDILEAIRKFCNENGWRARGLYTRKYIEVESDWYELIPSDIKDDTEAEWITVVNDHGNEMKLLNIRAYHEMNPSPKYWREEILVPERFRNVCTRNGISDANFCWIHDKGKYAAEQYFFLYGNQQIPHICVDRGLRRADRSKMDQIGGYLPKIATIFYELQQINLQDCYLAEDMPSSGIAYAYSPRTFTYCGRHNILIHKGLAEILLREKAISPSALRPAPVVSAVPGGYSLDETQKKERPSREYMDQMFAAYEKLKATGRPIRMVSEKDSLKVLRKAKRERKEDFKKSMPKTCNANLSDTQYSPLAPYYLIADGGFLSDEYEFLPYAQAIATTSEFMAQLAAEELLEEKPNGVVFAKCPDGDSVLICTDGTIIRFSHEEPVVTAQWPSLAQFIFDTITECE